MKILGIETSCDETGVGVVEDGRKILSHVLASQVEIHARFGGVVPEVASRQHLLTLLPLLKQVLKEADITPKELSGIGVTVGPGLPGSLLVGLNLAKALALAYDLPLIGVNHLEAHIYACWLEGREPQFPALCLIASGGHTELALMNDHHKFLLLGRTRDDAAGEALDKGARLLGLGYPGGPAIERAAKEGKPVVPLPRPWLKGTYHFSFSGLKTAFSRIVKQGGYKIADLASSFQEAVMEVLSQKTIQAFLEYGAKEILVCGGVASNNRLRELFSPYPAFFPSPLLCTDNGAMVASCGFFYLERNKKSGWELDVAPNLKLGETPPEMQ